MKSQTVHSIPQMNALLIVAIGVLLGSPALAQPTATPLDRPAPITRWDEALPIGNGLMGILVWGEGNTLRLSLDRADLWDTRLPEIFSSPDWTYAKMVRLKSEKNHAEHVRLFDVPYDTIPYPTKLPVGRLEITLPSDQTVSEFRAQSPSSASVRIEGTKRLSTLRLSIDSSNSVASIVDLPHEGVTFKFVIPNGFQKLGYPAAQAASDEDEAWYLQQTIADGSFAVAARLCPPAKKATSQSHFIVVSIVSSKESADPLAEARRRTLIEIPDSLDFVIGMNPTIDRSLVKPSSDPNEELLRHLLRERSNRSVVTLPNPTIQAHYDLAKHLYIAGSRPDAPPLALQGVWTADEGGLPPWKGDYHNDLNTQMTYLAYHDAGLIAQGLSWINFNWDLLPAYRSFAKSFYATTDPSSAVVPGVMTIDGKPMGGWGQYSLSPTHSAWVAQSFYLHWKYTNDPTFLHERAAPFCNSIANALADILIEPAASEPNNTWLLPLSSSPEFHDNSYAAWLQPNSTYDQSLLSFIFLACKEMGLKDTSPLVPLSDRARSAVVPPPAGDGASGLPVAIGHSYDQSHRHFSHAMSIHPLGLLTPGTHDAAIAATLDQIEKMGTKQWVGYSFSWFACMNARAGNADRALRYLTDYLAFTGPNGFHLNGDQTKSGLSDFTYRPFTLEGNFLAMQAVHEMLLQSWGTVGIPDSSCIRIFPAIPNAWPDVSFTNLRAEGGWRVSAARAQGRTTRVSITGSGGEVRFKDPFKGTGVWNRPIRELPGVGWACTLLPNETLSGTAE